VTSGDGSDERGDRKVGQAGQAGANAICEVGTMVQSMSIFWKNYDD
jgi:hypothetical protein